MIDHFRRHRLFYLILSGGIVLRLIFFSGFAGFDDKYYILQSYAYSQGIFETAAHQFGPRIGASLPAGLFVYLFGANAFSFALFPLACSILNMVIAYRLGHLLFPASACPAWAAFLMAVLPFEIIYASLFYIDLPLGTMLGLCLYCFLRGERDHGWYWYLLSGLFFGWAYLIKSTALFLVPALGIYALVQRKLRLQYLILATGVLIMAGGEMAFHAAANGDPLFRRNILSGRSAGIAEMKESNWEAYVEDKVTSPIQTGNFYVDRLLIEPVLTLFARLEFGIFFYLALPAFFLLLRRRPPDSIVVLIWFGWLLAYILFGSISPVSYIPLATLFVSARYFTIVFLPGALLAAKMISDAHLAPRRSWGLAAALLVIALLAVTFDASRHDKHIAQQSFTAFQRYDDARWIVDPNDYVAFLYFSGFADLEEVDLLFPDGNRGSKTLKSIFIIRPNIVGYDSLQNRRDVYVSVDERYLRNTEQKRLVESIPDAKAHFRNRMMGFILDPLGFDFAGKAVPQRHIFYLAPPEPAGE